MPGSASFIAILMQYKYAGLVPLAFISQPPTAMLAGIFVRLGYLDFPLTLICVVAGALLGDAAWYFIGYHWGERFATRFGKYFSITSDHIATVKRLFGRYDSQILVLSKVTNGLGLAIATLFTAGLSRISFFRFMLFNFIGESIWSGALIGVGIFFSQLYDQVNGALAKASTVGLFLLLVVALLAFSRWVYRRVTTGIA